MRHWTRYLTAAGLVLICSAVLFKGVPVASAAAASESPYRLTFKDVDGKKQTLESLRGQAIVLNFWATWCGPCKDELPMLNELAKDYAPKHVAFVAVSIDEKKDIKNVPQFLQEHQITLPVWVGASGDTLKALDLGDIVPATLILDQKGNVVSRIMGEARKDDITSRLDWIAGGESGTAPAAVVKRF